LLAAGSDSNNSGYVLLSSGESGDVEIYGPGSRQIAVFSTGTVTINTRSGANTFTSTFGSTGTLTVPQLAATTATVDLLQINRNNSRVTFPGITDYANTMLIANNNTSGPIIFTTKNATANRSLLIDRNANLVFHFGSQIQSTTQGGLSLSCLSTSTNAAVNISAGGGNFMSIGTLTGLRLASGNGVDQWITTMNTATGSWSFPTSISVTNTATAQTIISTTTTVTGMMTLPVYTKAALGAITGSVGQIAMVSDSAGGSNPNGMMAFWDLSNARWSYVHDNNAV
jgi:hypothetical protein